VPKAVSVPTNSHKRWKKSKNAAGIVSDCLETMIQAKNVN